MDVVIRTKQNSLEIMADLATSAERIGLQINKNKTKFIPTTSYTRAGNDDQNLTTNDHNFEAVRKYIYLGTRVDSKNDTSKKKSRDVLHLQTNLITSHRNIFPTSVCLKNKTY